MAAAAENNQTFLDLIKVRRTIYALGDKVELGKQELVDLIQNVIKNCPSSFNSQSSRAVILFGEESKKAWALITAELKKIVPEDQFAATQQKMDAFAAGFGTILFYEDMDVIAGLQKAFASYADNFPVWSEHGTGIAQFAVWTALAQEKIGASLQHYNPLPDQAFQEAFGVPASWKLRAQMPFGSIEAPAGPKEFMKDEDRFKVFGL